MKFFFIPFLVLGFTEALKTVVQSVKSGRFDLSWFLRSGGMPSGHSSFTAAIATVVGSLRGWQSAEFLLALGLAVVVMYDARGVRQAVSRHARLLNQLSPATKVNPLEESIGHTNLQVLVGGVIGVLISLLLLNF